MITVRQLRFSLRYFRTSSEHDTIKGLDTANDIRLAADWLSNAKYELGFDDQKVRKNWPHLIKLYSVLKSRRTSQRIG